MTTALAGTIGFGPQSAKGEVPSAWYRHKAVGVDYDILDDERTGPPEIGGRPVPTTPYKAGYVVGGGMTILPRLQDSLGWLLYQMCGDLSSEDAQDPDAVLDDIALLVGTQAGYTTGVTSPVKDTVVFVKVVTAGDGIEFTGDVTIHGTDDGDLVAQETISLSNVAEGAILAGTQIFRTITSIDLPVYENDGDIVSVGYLSGRLHVAKYLASDPSFMPWLAVRKHIPRQDGLAATDVGLNSLNNKIVGASFTIPNTGLVQARIDMLGIDWDLDYDPTAWSWDNAFEDYRSVPNGLMEDAYISINDPTSGLSGKLKVLGITFAIENIPVNLQQQRHIGGGGKLAGIEIGSRQLRIAEMVVLWENPDLYAAMRTGSTGGTNWSVTPFTCALDVNFEATENMTGESQPCGLRLQAPEIQLRQASPIALGGANNILIPLTGIGLDPASGDYFTLGLRNAVNNYTWPT